MMGLDVLDDATNRQPLSHFKNELDGEFLRDHRYLNLSMMGALAEAICTTIVVWVQHPTCPGKLVVHRERQVGFLLLNTIWTPTMPTSVRTTPSFCGHAAVVLHGYARIYCVLQSRLNRRPFRLYTLMRIRTIYRILILIAISICPSVCVLSPPREITCPCTPQRVPPTPCMYIFTTVATRATLTCTTGLLGRRATSSCWFLGPVRKVGVWTLLDKTTTSAGRQRDPLLTGFLRVTDSLLLTT